MKYLIFIIVLVTMLSISCRTPSPITSHVVERERVVQVKDTASIVALMECDSTNQVVMKAYSLQSTPNIKQDYTFENGKLTVSILNKRDSIIYNYKDSIIFVPSLKQTNTESNHLTTICALSGVILLLLLYVLKRK